MKRTTGRKTRRAEGFAAHAADIADLDALLEFVKAYSDFDERPYRSERIRTALGILLNDPSLGRVWIIRYGRKAVGHAILTLCCAPAGVEPVLCGRERNRSSGVDGRRATRASG